MNKNYSNLGRVSPSTLSMDAGLRQFMIGVYNYMLGALALSGAIAYYVGSQPELVEQMAKSGFMWVVLLAPIGIVLFLGFRIQAMSITTAQICFWAYAGLMGLGLAPMLMVFTSESVARVFFITAATFGGMSLYGYTTKRDLTSIGSFLIMGVWGIFIASIINIFLGSTMMGLVLSILSVLIFTGLAAYDTQKIKQMYYESDNAEIAVKKSVLGALNLYIDFIGLFINLLRLMGERR